MQVEINEKNQTRTEVNYVGKDLVEFTLSINIFGPFIRRIDLSFNRLKNINGLNLYADTLEELILDNNQLDKLEFSSKFTKLSTLSLCKNNIWNLNSLLSELNQKAQSIRYLSLLGNPSCPDQLTSDFVKESDYTTYRYFCLSYLKNSLRFLDSRQVTSKEISSSLKFVESIRKESENFGSSNVSNGGNSFSGGFVHKFILTPLSHATLTTSNKANNTIKKVKFQLGQKSQKNQNNSSGSGTMGKRKYKYLGKNSEGNRFIIDNDL